MSEKEKDEKTELEEKERVEKTEEEVEKEESDEEVTSEINNEEKSDAEDIETEEISEVEQLDDEDFENEKARIKAEKKAVKLAKKQAKQVYDAEGNPIEKKKMKKKTKIIILVCILIVIVAIAGTIAYLIINPNNDKNFVSELMIESVIKDSAIYYNNGEWEEFANCIDMDEYLINYAISLDEYYAESTGQEQTLTYSRYDEIKADIEGAYAEIDEKYSDYLEDSYDQIKDVITSGETDKADCFDKMISNGGISSLEVETIKSISKVEGTDALYKVSVIYSYGYDSSTNTTTQTVDMYVSHSSGEYKIVSGDFAETLFFAYYFSYYYDEYMSYYYGT